MTPIRPRSIQRPPQDPEELWWLVRALWGYSIPLVQVCPHHVAPFQAFCSAYFAWDEVAVWKACLLGDSLVTTDLGPVRLDELSLGTKLLGWTGSGLGWGELTGRWVTGVDDVLLFETRSGDLPVTANHRVLTYRKEPDPGPGRGNYRRVAWKPAWVRAGELRPGDYLVQPYDYEPARVVFDDAPLAEALGLVVGDGFVTHYKLGISHHPEATYMGHYRDFFRERFGKELRPQTQIHCSWIDSREVASLFAAFDFGQGARAKRVPKVIFQATRESKLAFLRGYLDADGTIRDDGQVSYYSANPDLLMDVRELCLSLGLSAGRVGYRPMAGTVRVRNRWVTRGDMYDLSVYGAAPVIGTNDTKYQWIQGERQAIVQGLGGRWRGPDVLPAGIRLRRIQRVSNLGPKFVWDVSVSGTESLVCDTFLVHNSRGFGGKSSLLAILALTEQVCLGASVTILGGSLLQSERVHDVMSKAWDYPTAPSNLLIRAPTKQITRLTNHSTAVALAASQRSVRGPHPQRLRCIAEGQIVETQRGPQPIELVEVGDDVIGADPQTYRLQVAKVSAAWCSGVKETLRLSFDDGSQLICTEQHPILTPRGYRRAETLSVGSAVFTCPSLKAMQAFSVLYEAPGPIQPPHYPRVLSLVQRDRPIDKPVQYRDRDEFPPLPGSERQGRSIRFTKQDALALLGHGALFALKMLSGGRPSVAGGWLSRLTSNLPGESSTQETPESQRSVSPVEPIEPGKARLVKVELAGKRRVWDLTVPGPNSFVVSGVLVKNCDEVDEMDWEVYEAALGQPISAPGIPTQVVASSTYHNPRGTFWKIMEEAKKNNQPLYEWCISGRTLVSTPTGPVQMRELDKGRTLYGYDLGKLVEVKVEDFWCSGTRATLQVKTDLGKLTCTVPHRVYTDKGWKLAGQLKTGDIVKGIITLEDGSMSTVCTPIRDIATGPPVPVYDLTVDRGACFFAGGILVHNCYRETSHPEGGWLEPGEVDRARRRMTSRRFAVEYDLQEPLGEASAIMKDKVDQCFDEDAVIFRTVISLEDEEHYLIEPPMPGALYATGADWGRRTDYCVFCTFRVDVAPIRCVHWVRVGRQSWPDLIARLDDVMTRYGGGCVHDGTGIGDVIDDFVKERGESMEAVWLSGKLRQTIFEEYIVAIENDQITYPRLTYAYNEHLDCTTRDLYGAGHPPDSFVAGALAYRARLLAESDEEFF